MVESKVGYWHTENIGWLKERYPDWACIGSIGMVESKRTIRDKTTIERSYHIASFKMNVKQFACAVRQHWGIENRLHWVLDVVLKEDSCRIRNNNSPQNMAIYVILLLMLRKEKHWDKQNVLTNNDVWKVRPYNRRLMITAFNKAHSHHSCAI
jgi:predicted transposase YbfD/YdcC